MVEPSADASAAASMSGGFGQLPLSAVAQRRPGLADRPLRVAAAVASIVAAAGVSVALAATSDHVARPAAVALYYGFLVTASLLAALYWRLRRPESTLGRLLAIFGATVWVVSWQSSDWALAFDIGVLAEGPGLVLTFYLFLAFPSGRLRTTLNRVLIAALTVAALAFFIPWALFTPALGGGGPLSACRLACPENVLQIGSHPGLADTAGRWETYAMLAIGVIVLGVYWARVSTASRPQRRALLAVAATSLLFLPVFLMYHFSRLILEADAATLEPMAWALVLTRVMLPLGFVFALFGAEQFAGVARQKLLEQLLRHPSPHEWRDAVAAALDDPRARVAFWDPAAARYREPDGTALTAPAPGSGRSLIEVRRDRQPVAAMVIDEALAEDPELVRAASSTTILAVENGNLEGQLRATQTRVREVEAIERKRIERNLHDSAQQRLLALRINLELTSERLQGPERLQIERFGAEIDEAIQEVRTAASGGAPPELALRGVAPALRSLARPGAMPVVVEDHGFGRRSELIETTVFFCCAEALQNATKHAGPGASARVELSCAAGWVQFRFEDDGNGCDLRTVERGSGLAGMRERLVAVGGSLAIESVVGKGTRVSGRVPATL
jgi:signal transduction histidine kinase